MIPLIREFSQCAKLSIRMMNLSLERMMIPTCFMLVGVDGQKSSFPPRLPVSFLLSFTGLRVLPFFPVAGVAP
jgi:hypothetical protein